MMKLPESLPLQLMLMMMQSGGSPSASMPWSANLHSFFPWLPKPKSPLEQSAELVQNLWQQTSDQWLKANEAWLKSLSPQPGASQPSVNNPFADLIDPAFVGALSGEMYQQSTGFLQGLQAYMASDYERPAKEYDVLWQRGSAQLFDLAPDNTDGVAVLCVPSLINKSTILDLYPEVSFVEFLKSRGLRPLILDWGTPGEDEEDFTTADYINAYALDALQTLREQHDGPIVLLGYCMGGIFTVAMAQLAEMFVDGMILFATPWDFSAEDTPRVLLDPTTQNMFRQWITVSNPVPVMLTQTLFHLIDPWRPVRKFQRFPGLSEAEKHHFLAVEQWVNDGVPLAQGVAGECFVDWPQGNILATHQWKIGRRWIEPQSIKTPTLAVIPAHDPIVPKGCALPLTKELPRCDVLIPNTGHVSMVIGSRAKKEVWEPVANWIQKKF